MSFEEKYKVGSLFVLHSDEFNPFVCCNVQPCGKSIYVFTKYEAYDGTRSRWYFTAVYSAEDVIYETDYFAEGSRVDDAITVLTEN